MTGYLLWKWLQVIDIKPHGWRVNIASDNAVVATGNKPLTEPTLVQFYIATLHQWSTMSCHHIEIGFQLFADRQRCLRKWLSYDTCLCSCTIVSTTQCLARLYGMKNVEMVMSKSVVIFIQPFENRTYYAVAMSVRPSVCPSVRPSVRPRFPDFSLTCFEISIWNLVYTFSRWHDMSSLSCITIGSLWPSLQPKVGQTHFLQSWPHKSRYILQIWYTDGLLCTSRHKFRFCKNIIFGILAIIFAAFGFCEVFWAFFLHVLRYQFETWYIHAVGGVTRQVRVLYQSGHFDLLYSQK